MIRRHFRLPSETWRLQQQSFKAARRWASSASEAEAKRNAARKQRLYGTIAGMMVFPISAFAVTTIYDKYYAPHMDGFWDTITGEEALREQRMSKRMEEMREADAGPKLGGTFELTDCTTKKRITDKQLFDGHWTLLYFGFTRCAEVCPGTMRWLEDVYRLAQEELPAEHKEKFQKLRVAFISVDHLRDKPDDLKKFLKKYNIPSIGLVGSTRQEIETATKAWRVFFSSVDETDEERELREKAGQPAPNVMDEHYQLDHSAAIYFVGPDGKLKDFFFREMGASHAVERITMQFMDVYGINEGI